MWASGLTSVVCVRVNSKYLPEWKSILNRQDLWFWRGFSGPTNWYNFAGGLTRIKSIAQDDPLPWSLFHFGPVNVFNVIFISEYFPSHSRENGSLANIIKPVQRDFNSDAFISFRFYHVSILWFAINIHLYLFYKWILLLFLIVHKKAFRLNDQNHMLKSRYCVDVIDCIGHRCFSHNCENPIAK